MLEKEIKVLDINKDKVIEKLISLGAVKTFEGYIHDVYYDFVDGDKKKMQENDRLFRIRKKGEIHMYTIKRKRMKAEDGGEKGVKIADEGENIITDVESFEKVLKKYGMQKVREKKKYRTSFKLLELEFDIDEYDEIPTLLEIEAKTKNELDKYIKELGLQKNVLKTFGSRGLFKYYGKEYLNFD